MQLRSLALALTTAAVVTPIATIAMTAGTASAAPAADHRTSLAGRTLVIGDCKHPSYEPKKIIPACADLNDYATIDHWDTWTKDGALGYGQFSLNDCKPDCASGHFHTYPATLRLRKAVKKADGTRVFRKLRVTYEHNGHRKNLTLDLPTTPVIIS